MFREHRKNIDVEYDIVEGFSSAEYEEFQKRLIEYPILKQDLDYYKKVVESYQRQMEYLLKAFQRANKK